MSQVFDALRKAEQSRKAMLTEAAPREVAQSHSVSNQDRSESAVTYVGAGLQIRGEITGKEPMLIEGRVDGAISIGNCRLTVAPSAQVCGQVLAGDVIVHGTLEAEVRATERIVILSTASVSGQLTAPRIMIEEGAFLNAAVEVQAETMPASPLPLPSKAANA